MAQMVLKQLNKIHIQYKLIVHRTFFKILHLYLNQIESQSRCFLMKPADQDQHVSIQLKIYTY